MASVQRRTIVGCGFVASVSVATLLAMLPLEAQNTNRNLTRWVVYDADGQQFYTCKNRIEQRDAHLLAISPSQIRCMAWDDGRSDTYFITQSLDYLEVVNGSFLTNYQVINQNVQTIAPYVPPIYTGAPQVAGPPPAAAAREAVFPQTDPTVLLQQDIQELGLSAPLACNKPKRISYTTADPVAIAKAAISLCVNAQACAPDAETVKNETFGYLAAWARTLKKVKLSDGDAKTEVIDGKKFTADPTHKISPEEQKLLVAVNACIGDPGPAGLTAGEVLQNVSGETQDVLDSIYKTKSPNPAPYQLWQQPQSAEIGTMVLCATANYHLFKGGDLQDSPDVPSDACQPPQKQSSGGTPAPAKPVKPSPGGNSETQPPMLPSTTLPAVAALYADLSDPSSFSLQHAESAPFISPTLQYAVWRKAPQVNSPSYLAVSSSDSLLSTSAPQNAAAPPTPPPPGNGAAPPAAPIAAAPQPQYVNSRKFMVRLQYHASILAGFFVSTLGTNEYGFTNSGQGGTTFVNVVVAQDYSRPQVHAFTGVNMYFKPHDSTPGLRTRLLDPQEFGFLIGYGIDGGANYLAGLNWQVKNSGLNISGGAHIGQVSQLAPGVYPGVTEFPSSITSVPTVAHTKLGAFLGISLDINTMKNAIGSLFSK
jgi:hypothetical protein